MAEPAPTSDRPLPPAYVLAGGRSRRFGSDKARVVRHGMPGLVWLREQLLAFGCPRVTAIAREDGAYYDLGVTTIADLHPELGPLGGLEAALSDARENRILLLSCDLLELRESWLRRLTASPGQAVAFHQETWHPFPGCYERSLLPVVTRRLSESGAGRSFQSLLNAPEVASVALPLPADWPEVVSFNTQRELEAGTVHAR